MATQQIGEAGHAEQHGREREVVAPVPAVQQQRVGRLVDGETGGRHGEEAPCRDHGTLRVAGEAQTVVAGERHREGHGPAGNVGRQRPPVRLADQRDDDAPVHGGRGAADDDEPGRAALHDAICLCVDDVGLHPGIDDAALHLVALGRVHALSALVGGPSWAAASGRLRRLDAGTVDIGLHLDFTACPLRRGSRRRHGDLVARCLLGRLDRGALRDEVRAQFDAFEAALGRRPAYVDGHHHVHQLPLLRTALFDELERRYGAGGPWLRSTRHAPGLGWRATLKAVGIEALGGWGFAALARRHGHAMNGHLLGVYDFQGGPARYAALLAGWLQVATAGDLLMCHPALRSHGSDRIGGARRAEYAVLSGTAFAGLLRASGRRLAPMSRILQTDGLHAG